MGPLLDNIREAQHELTQFAIILAMWCGAPHRGAPVRAAQPQLQVPRRHSEPQNSVNMAARFLNRVAGLGATVGIGGFCLQECIYDGACPLILHVPPTLRSPVISCRGNLFKCANIFLLFLPYVGDATAGSYCS